MKKIYFLCTGNSCRSQMAEGYAHQLFNPENVMVKSAGIETHGLNPRAVEVMKEDTVDITSQTSDLIDLEYFNDADLIITLCGDAKDKCPTIPPTANHIHWDLTDPAQATGTEEEIMNEFRHTRDTIKGLISELNQEIA